MINEKNKKTLLIIIITFLMMTTIGFSAWVIIDKIVFKPTIEVDKVITRYLDGLEGVYDGNVLLPSSQAIGEVEAGKNTDCKYFYKNATSNGDYIECIDDEINSVGPIDAGDYLIKVTYKINNEKNKTIEGITFSILKATIDISSLKFEDTTKTYSREKQIIEVSGELPKGIEKINYSGGGIDVGTYDVEASFVVNKNYNEVDSLYAELTIESKSITNFEVDFSSKISQKNLFFVFLSNITLDEIKNTFSLKDNDYSLIKDIEYSIIWNSNLEVGVEYSIEINGIGNYKDTLEIKYELQRPLIYVENKYDTIQSFIYNATIQYPELKAYILSNNTKIYIDDFNTDTFQIKFYDYNEYEKNNLKEIEPIDAGQYRLFAIAINENYTSPIYDGENKPSPISMLIKAKDLNVSWSNTIFEYDKTKHAPTAIVSGICDIDKDTCTYSVIGAQTNAGTYSASVILNQDKNNYSLRFNTKINFTIKKRVIEVNNSMIEMNYNTEYRTWDEISSYIKNSIKFDSSNIIEGDIIATEIIGMHNGIFGYGTTNLDNLNDSSQIGVIIGNDYDYVVGSTYTIIASVSDPNYEVKLGSIIFKYKTALVNNNYYTIEDAINNTNGDITFVGNATSFNSFVYTSFCGLTKEQGFPYDSNTFKIGVSRKLVVPCKSNQTEDYEKHNNTSVTGNIYSCLYIPSQVILNVDGNITISAVVSGSAQCGNVGVILNNGVINVNSNGTINSYGYIKGNNIINAMPGSNVMEIMRMFDYPGSVRTTSSVINSGCFPIVRWSLHNISCNLKIYNGAQLNGFSAIWGSNAGYQPIEFTIIHKDANTKDSCLFMPNDNSKSTNFILFYGTNVDNSYIIKLIENKTTIHNQIEGQKDFIEINGDYLDGKFTITLLGNNVSTSAKMPIPLSYFNLKIAEKSNVTISKSSYVFLLGTKLVVEKNASLKINDCYIALDKKNASNKSTITNGYFNNTQDAILENYGNISGTGSIGGNISLPGENSSMSLNYNIDSIKIKIVENNTHKAYEISNYKLMGTQIDKSTNTIQENVEFDAGFWISKFEDSSYYWCKETEDNIVNFSINFYDSDETTLLNEIKIMKIKDAEGKAKYNVTGEEFSPSKRYYEFEKWVNKEGVTLDNTEAFTLNETKTTINLYARWSLKEYQISYTAGYGKTEEGLINYIDPVYQNKVDRFTIDSFGETGILKITTIASYELSSDEKVFVGWYIGIDKTINKTFNQITKLQFDAYLDNFDNPDLIDTLPLYCEFVDVLVSIKFNTDKGYVNDDNMIRIAGGESIELPNLDNMTINNYNNDPTSEIYFAGWTLEGDLNNDIYKPGTIYNISHNIQFNAVWKTKEIKLTINYINFDDNDIIKTEYKYYISNNETAQIGKLFAESTIENNDKFFKFKEYTLVNIDLNNDSWIVNNSSEIKFLYNELFSITIDVSGASVNYKIENDSNSYTETQNHIAILGQKIVGTITYTNDKNRSTTIKKADGTLIVEDKDKNETFAFSFLMPSSDITIESSSSCIVEGTLITLADGTKKKVEELEFGDLLLTWNFFKGTFDAKPVIAIEKSIRKEFNVLTICLSNGEKLQVVGGQSFFDMLNRQYFEINHLNYLESIGKEIMIVDNDRMSSATITDIYEEIIETVAYEVITAEDFNFVANNILTIEPFIFWTNTFEINENYQYDKEQMEKDIEKYGLYKYEEWSDYLTKEEFEAFNGKYFKVAVGKGLITEEYILEAIKIYLHIYSH